MSSPLECDVLVVDDEPDLREVFVCTLEAHGYRVGEASSASAALARVAAMSAPPRLILLDLVMPGMSAADFLSALRGRPGCASVPVILVSGATDLVHRAEALGRTDYLMKPVSMRALAEAVQRHLGLGRHGATS